MLFRKKRHKIEPDLTKEDMEELVTENIQFAERYSNEGNVSGMEMSLEIVLKYSQKIGKNFDSHIINKIKLKGYELGEKNLREMALKYEKEGKVQEARNAINLANIYGNEAKLLKYII